MAVPVPPFKAQKTEPALKINEIFEDVLKVEGLLNICYPLKWATHHTRGGS